MSGRTQEAIAGRRSLWVLLWRAGRWRLAAFGTVVALQGLMPIVAIVASGILVGAVPDAVAGGEGSPAAGRALGGLVLFAAALTAGAVLAAVADHETQVLNGRYGEHVHRAVAAATLRTRGIAGLEDPAVVGEIAAIEEMERADGFVATVTSLRELILRRASGAGAFVVLLGFAWWAPLVMLAGWRGLSFGVRRWVEHGMELGSTAGAGEMRRARYLRSLAVEPSAAKEVRVFGLAGRLVQDYGDAYLDALRSVWAGRRLGMRTVVSATWGVLVAHLLVLGAVGAGARSGAVSLAELVVFVQAVLATSALGYVFGAEVPLARARQVATSVRRLRHGLADPPGPGSPPRTAGTGDAAVHVHDVRFTYPGRDRPTLDGVTVTIPRGQSVAIVGANGAGKSTLVKLLCGFYEPDRGRIEIGGAAPAAARDRISAIFQNFTRYALPIRDNVAFGDPRTPHDLRDLAAALRSAGADDLVAGLPLGWDTVLAPGHPDGHDLSGGQWQKVALARAFVAVHGGAELLVMDEPTANLDVRAEAELFDRFLEYGRGVTTILVSHRLASVRRAERIVVLADGRVVEDGTHAELMASGGRYAEMFALQASRFADEPAGRMVDADGKPVT